MLSKFYFLFIWSILVSEIHSNKRLLPKYDNRCDAITNKTAFIDPTFYTEQEQYFNKEVPKVIHQIWFGDILNLNQNQVDKWKEYASILGYEYKLWTIEHELYYKSFINPVNYHILNMMLINKNWWAASDILRYEILNNYGGVYVDIDFNPPESCGDFVDFIDICSMKGLTLMTENHARNIGRSAIFCANGFIMVSRAHPFIQELTLEINNNCHKWFKAHGNYDAMMCTGPFFLNRMLSGNYNILPITYLRELGMID